MEQHFSQFSIGLFALQIFTIIIAIIFMYIIYKIVSKYLKK